MIRYRARWVLPVARPPIADGVVAVQDGKIAYVGDARDAPQAPEEPLGDVLLMPGLINAHTHLELTGMRGFLEKLEFHEWITTLTRARRDVLSDAMLLDSARLGISEGVRAGVTTFADTCESGVALAAMREAGVRGIVYQEVFGPDPARCSDSIARLRERLRELRLHETSLVRVGVSPHAPYSVSDDLFAATAQLAAAESLPMAIHVAESEAEDDLIRRGRGPFADLLTRRSIGIARRAGSPVELLARTGVLATHPLLIHCVRAGAADLDLIAAAGSAIAHCPASNAKLGHGIASVTDMLARGIPVGLGSDSVASNNRMDILDEARLAVLFQRARLAEHDALSAEQALEMATLGGARALGLERVTGSLEVGKDADIAAFALAGARGTPVTDPVAAAVFAIAGNDASLVAVGGRVIARRGRVFGADPGLPARVQVFGDALADWRSRGGVAWTSVTASSPGASMG
ncbi:MAG: amidohydrolase family protein [Gemmatimonadaceae bacterium]